MSLCVRVNLINQPAAILDSDVLGLSDDDIWRLARRAIQSAGGRYMNIRVVLWDRASGGEWTLEGTCTHQKESR